MNRKIKEKGKERRQNFTVILSSLSFTFTLFLFQEIVGSGWPRGGMHSITAGSPAATTTSLGVCRKSSRRTEETGRKDRNNQRQGLGITMNIIPPQIATLYCAYYAAAFWDISLVSCNHFVSWFSWFNLFAMRSCSPPGLNLLTVHVCLINNALFPLTRLWIIKSVRHWQKSPFFCYWYWTKNSQTEHSVCKNTYSTCKRKNGNIGNSQQCKYPSIDLLAPMGLMISVPLSIWISILLPFIRFLSPGTANTLIWPVLYQPL